MCDYSLEAYRSRPAQLGERYETHRFESYSVGFVAPGDPSTAVCLECDMKLRLEGIPERVQRAQMKTSLSPALRRVSITTACALAMARR
jgi:hypothetical protein